MPRRARHPTLDDTYQSAWGPEACVPTCAQLVEGEFVAEDVWILPRATRRRLPMCTRMDRSRAVEGYVPRACGCTAMDPCGEDDVLMYTREHTQHTI
jgi:hypothetical protein